MEIRKEVKEMINRNLGEIDDTILVVDQLILIYSILSAGRSNNVDSYKCLAVDLLNLKVELQVQKEKYEQQKKE